MKRFSLFLFALVALGHTAWAEDPTSVNYINAAGGTHTASAYLITSSHTVLGMQNSDVWYYVTGNVEINSQVTYISNINLILCDGASLTINTTDEDAIHCSADNLTLTIYGQTNGTGQLTATATSSSGIYTEYFTINGGVINASGSSNGIYANKTLVINRGTVTANGNDWGMRGDVVTINGGNVTANGGGILSSGMTSTLTIGYTNSSDRIYSTKYQSGYTGNMMKVKSGQYMKTTDTNFIIYGKVNDDWKDAIAGHTLMPYTPTEWSGSGTAQSPYIISSVDDLNLLSIRTNGGTHPYSDTCFKLGANITFTASSDWNDASSTESNFTAIPTFSGHFDGDVYTISGLRIRKDDGVGLFSYLAEGAVVENITLSNSRVTGNSQIGGIVGSLQPGATVNNCHVTNTVYVYSKYHFTGVRGGVVGYSYSGTISNCVSEATISSTTEVWDNTNDKAGGIVGVNESGTLTGNLVIGANITCYTENYGAIAGNNESGTLSNNYYHACTVNSTANAVNIGVNGADITTSNGAMSIHTITKPNDVTITTDPTLVYGGTNYWKHGTTITLNDGLDGTPTEGWQKAYSINDVVISENSTTIKDNFDMPAEDVTIRIGEIHADWANTPNNPTAGSSSDNPYKIYFTDQLDLLATRVNNGTSTYSGKYFKLMDDLTYDNTEQNNYIAIGTGSNPFSGHFDGNQKTINGIRINSTGGYLGVFGLIENADVNNLYVNDIEITGHDHVGCLVGECNGSTISNCRVTTATLTATGKYSDCPYFGGIAGYYMGTSTMSNNFVLGIDIPQVYHFGAIVGDAGSNQGLASNYYHNCSVSGTAYAMGIGRNGGDVTTNDGAIPVFTVSVPNGVTATATATVTHNTVNYYKKNVPVTLSGGLDGTPGEGLQYAYVVYGETLTGSNLAPGHEFDMQNANAVVTIGSMIADWATEQGAGDTEGNPYKIYYKEQLDLLATRVNAGESYSGKYFKLMDDLTYDNTQQNNYIAIGTDSNPFSGHFDGNQKTINGIRIYGTGSYQGVFGYIVDAEVKDLYVNDIEITAHDRVGSIVGECDGSTAITGCRVTTATLNVAGDATYQQLFGGIAGRKSGSTSTMSNNFVLGLTIPQVYHFGAIAGDNGGSSLVSNYYHNCSAVGSPAYSTGIGCNHSDVEGAKPVFTLTLADGISTDVSPVVIYNTVDYYENGATINLSYVTPANPGYEHIYSVNGTPIEGDSFVLNANATVTVAPNRLIDWETEYAGSEMDPYLISNVEQWNLLATRVNDGTSTYSGRFFKLMENISVTTMVGGGDGSDYVFSGTFDGDGHTITFNVNNTSEQYTAPFRRIDGATVKGIRLNGNVTSSNRFAGGIVAYAKGTSTVTDCVNSTAITSIGENDNSSNGGIVGMVGGNGTINITGCVFNGEMTGVTNSNNTWSGILGLCNDNCTANIRDCFIDPVSAVEHGNTVYRNSGTTHCSNCYYTKTIGNAQGLKARSITGGTDVTVSFAGDANVYDVSNITAYTNGNANLIGLKYGNTLYAGKNETVSLNLEFSGELPEHHAPAYTASNATISGTENPFTLNMDSSTDAAVVISCNNAVLAWEGHGTEDDPYLIHTNEQWDLLAEKVNTDNKTYSGIYFKLMADITISYTIDNNYPDYLPKLVGYDENHSFQGTFDGNNHKITLDYYDQTYVDVCAPFRFVKNATIKRLLVDGEIQKEYKKNVASIVGDSYGTTNLISCYSEAGVYNHKGNHTNDPDERDGTSGGLVGRVSGGTINLTNCSYNGKFAGTSGTLPGGCTTYTTKWGGLVAYVGEDCTANLINCFCEIRVELWDTDGSEYFARKHSDATVNLINCYRSDKLEYPNPGDTNKVFPNSDQGIDATNMTDEELHNALGYAWMTYASTYHDHHVHPVTAPQTFTGQGTESEPYQIASSEDWDKLAIYVAHKDNHSSDYFQMTNNISTTNMIGLLNNLSFQGTFDGAGNTLNLDYNVTYMPDNKAFSTAAPFAYISNAAIKNLHITGSIATVGMRPASVAGFVVENSSITNCKSEVAISSSYNNDIDAGGFVARVNEEKPVTLTGCLFTGSITYSNTAGYEGSGMVGWTQDNATATLTDCVFAPSAIHITKFVTNNDDKKHRMFVGGKRDYVNLTSCYYNDVAAASGMVAEGERVYSIIPAEPVTMSLLGVAQVHDVSGITVYDNGSHGLKFDDVFYAVSGSSLSLELGVEPGYSASAYYANGTELTESGWFNNSYGLMMPAQNVTITAPGATLVTVYRQIDGYGESTESDHWAFIASPIAGSIAPTNVTNLIGNAIPGSNPVLYDFDLYRFNPNTDLEWENYHAHTSDFNIVNGTGYLYATKEDKTLAFSGTFNTGTSMDVTGLPQGFNLVGNPFTVDAYVNKPYYTLNSNGSAILTTQSTSVIPPCYGVIVEVNENETVTFNKTGQFSAGPNNGGLNVALTQANTRGASTGSATLLDNAIVSFNEGSQLGKFYFGNQNANIYLPQNGKDYAIAFSDKQGEVPVNFKANENGTYTLSVNPEGVEMGYLHLIDNMTGADVDLLTAGPSTGSGTSYTFTAKTTDYESRFKLVFGVSTPSTGSGTSATFAFVDANGNIVITDGPSTGSGTYTLQIVDVMGRVIVSRDAARNISTSGIPAGVYVLRLIDGNDVKTQRIIIQ